MLVQDLCVKLNSSNDEIIEGDKPEEQALDHSIMSHHIQHQHPRN